MEFVMNIEKASNLFKTIVNMKFFALTTRGLEKFAVDEIKELIPSAMIIEQSYRKIIFEAEFEPQKLGELRSVEDVFIHIASFGNVGHTLRDRKTLAEIIIDLPYSPAISELVKFRKIKTFSISPSSVGKRNFSTIDLKEALYKPLASKLNLLFEDEVHDGFDIRIMLEHSEALIGVRIFEKPLHRRAYKVETSVGSLKPSIAHCMCRFAGLKTGDKILDPFCGSGTILCEAISFHPSEVIGGDINENILRATQKNLANLEHHSYISIQKWDAQSLPFENNCFDSVITNITLGKHAQVPVQDSIYVNGIKEMNRVLKKHGTIVLLVDNETRIQEIIASQRSLKMVNSIEISLRGELAYMLKMQKN